MHQGPLVSIVVPCFNTRPLLVACLGSLLKQTYSNLEIILVDDASTDGGPQLVKKRFPSPKIKTLVNPTNSGPSRTRNRGIATARGRYVAFFETDMTAERRWISVMVDLFENHPGIAAAHSRVFDLKRRQYIQADGMFLIPYTGWVVMRNYGLTAKQADSSRSPVIIGSVGTFVRRQTLLDIGGFDEALGHKVDDLDLGWRIWLTGKKSVSVPQAVTYHWGGKPASARPISTLKAEIYFHRMTRVFLKNYQLSNLFKYFPWLVLLSLARSVKHALSGNFSPILGLINTLAWTVITLPDTLKQRRIIQSSRRISDSQLFAHIMVPGSFASIWKNYVLPTHRVAHTTFAR